MTLYCSAVAESPIAGHQPTLIGSTQQPSTGQPSTTAATAGGGGGGGAKLESGSGSSLKSGQSAGDSNKAANDGSQGQSQEPLGGSASTIPSGDGHGGEESTASIFLQTAAYLLDVHALKVHYYLLLVFTYYVCTCNIWYTSCALLDLVHNFEVAISVHFQS